MPKPKNLTDGLSMEIRLMLSRGEEVNMPGIGKLKVINKAARMARNPQTGGQVQVPARRVVKFSQSSSLKEVLAQG